MDEAFTCHGGLFGRSVVFAVFAWGLLCGLASRLDAQTVRTESGELRGKADAQGVTAYLGVPFAAPPVGELRWKAPQAVAAWSGVRDAREFGAVCMQNELKAGSFY